MSLSDSHNINLYACELLPVVSQYYNPFLFQYTYYNQWNLVK